jgi:4-diphosphocytidyl-2-C-methyl-D-erythritol kinase
VNRAPATAKLNLALVVGPRRADGKHEVTTVLQRLAFCDLITVEPSSQLEVAGFDGDTLVRAALRALAETAGNPERWRARIDKRIPVASGLGGGSSDAATALRLANGTLAAPVEFTRLDAIARGVGADVPFFLRHGPQLGEGDGTTLTRLDLPQDYFVVLVLPHNAMKTSTRDVYAAFEGRDGASGYERRRLEVLDALARIRRQRDLAVFPPNDLASSPLADELRRRGAFRADVSGAGPIVYGLFLHREGAVAARRALRAHGRTWLTMPAWYG